MGSFIMAELNWSQCLYTRKRSTIYIDVHALCERFAVAGTGNPLPREKKGDEVSQAQTPPITINPEKGDNRTAAGERKEGTTVLCLLFQSCAFFSPLNF